jgi:FlaA1/EpsC-like NDP-sugar epimerase
MRTKEQAEREIALIGLRPGDLLYDKMLSAAERGWPAWRIAQAHQLSPDLIYRLGGPASP